MRVYPCLTLLFQELVHPIYALLVLGFPFYICNLTIHDSKLPSVSNFLCINSMHAILDRVTNRAIQSWELLM